MGNLASALDKWTDASGSAVSRDWELEVVLQEVLARCCIVARARIVLAHILRVLLLAIAGIQRGDVVLRRRQGESGMDLPDTG